MARPAVFNQWFNVLYLLTILHRGCCLPTNTNEFVKTTKGLVRGTEFKTFDRQTTYHAFKGIPYAKPPVGALRFEHPVSVDEWFGIYNATEEHDICVQLVTTVNGSTDIRGSEDCLYLNLYTPKLPESKDYNPLPIMFYIHGGGFTEGSKDFNSYGPDLFMAKGVILVVIQYRLHVFGFLSTEDSSCPGNNAFKDQLQALHWVKENSRSFGGDPNKITIFGHSAGGCSIGVLVNTPLAKGLFRNAIIQSASVINIWARTTNSRRKAFEIGRTFGVSGNNSMELINKLKTVDYKELYTAAKDAADKFNVDDIYIRKYGPVIEENHKDAIITKKPFQQLENGEFNKVPIIMGFTSLEAEHFDSLMVRIRPRVEANFTYFVPSSLVTKDQETKIKVAKKIRAHYFKNFTNGIDEYNLLRYVSDNMFVRGILKASMIMAKQTPLYLYKFTYIGQLGDPKKPNRKGVGHAEEINYIFRKTPQILNISEHDALVCDRLVTMWTNFAKTDNPTPNKITLLNDVLWPVLNATTEYKYLDMDSALIVRKKANEEDLVFWDEMYKNDIAKTGWF